MRRLRRLRRLRRTRCAFATAAIALTAAFAQTALLLVSHRSRPRRSRSSPLCDETLHAYGASLGLGAIVVLGRSACPTTEIAFAATWLARATAGQCGPCVHGLAAITGALLAVRDGTAAECALRDIERWAHLSAGRGACAHPDGTARFVMSALRTFRGDLEDHLRQGRCEACEAPRRAQLPDRALAP